MTRTLGSVKLVFVVLTGLPLWAGCSIDDGYWGSRAKYERTVEMEHPLAAGSALTVTTASGSIVVTGQPVQTCHFVATIEARAPSEEEAAELAEDVELRFVESGSGLTIRAERPKTHGPRSISISYEVVVPHQASVACSSASGSVSAADLEGNVRAHTASGSVRAERVSGGNIHLDSASGQVRLADASGVGTCRMHTASGSVRAQRLEAESISLDSASGGVSLTDSRAESIRLHTSSGSVEAEAIHCARLRAESGSGSVNVRFADSAPGDVDAELRAGSGSVRATMPQGFAGQVDLSASSGSVQTDLPVTVRGKVSKRHLRGTIGDGAGRLSAYTGSGSVHIR
jgi:lia operon protein LiaG